MVGLRDMWKNEGEPWSCDIELLAHVYMVLSQPDGLTQTCVTRQRNADTDVIYSRRCDHESRYKGQKVRALLCHRWTVFIANFNQFRQLSPSLLVQCPSSEINDDGHHLTTS